MALMNQHNSIFQPVCCASKEVSMLFGRLIPKHVFVIALLFALIEVLKLALHDLSSRNGDNLHS